MIVAGFCVVAASPEGISEANFGYRYDEIAKLNATHDIDA